MKKINVIRKIDPRASIRALPVNGYLELDTLQVSKEVARNICSQEKRKGSGVYKLSSIDQKRFTISRIQ